MMKKYAEELDNIIEKVEPQLQQLNERELEVKSSPAEWSKKEILGHLIDSAANNHQRFVRAAYNVADRFPTYDQIKWIEIQRYNDIPWGTLIAFWVAYNRHLGHLIACIPSEAGSTPCNIGGEEPASLNYIVEDYLSHMRLHLEDILTPHQNAI